MYPSYVNRRICLLRWLGVQDVMPTIEEYLKPLYSHSAMQPTLEALKSMTWGPDTGGPWVAYHHLNNGNDYCIGNFTVEQCPLCYQIIKFRHVHGLVSLLFIKGRCMCSI
jgi:hypothetical protein